jgi:hypothetical protein
MKKVLLLALLTFFFIAAPKETGAIIPHNSFCYIGDDCTPGCSWFFALNGVDCSPSGGVSALCTQQGSIPNAGACACNCQNYWIECVDDSYCQTGEFCDTTFFWRCIDPDNACFFPQDCPVIGERCSLGECTIGCDQDVDCDVICPSGSGGTCNTSNGSCDCIPPPTCQITEAYMEACQYMLDNYNQGFPEDPACNGCGVGVGCEVGELCNPIAGGCTPAQGLCPNTCTVYGGCPNAYSCSYNTATDICEPVDTCATNTHAGSNCFEFNNDPDGCATAGPFPCLDTECYGDVSGDPGNCKILCGPYYHSESVTDSECPLYNPRCCLPGGVGYGGPGGITRPLPAICTLSNGDTGIDTAIGCIPVSPQNGLVSFLVVWGVGIGGGIALLLIAFAGIMIVTSGGDYGKIVAGKQLLMAAVAGLLLLIFSVFILRLIGVDILRIPGF